MPWFYILVSINKHCDTWKKKRRMEKKLQVLKCLLFFQNSILSILQKIGHLTWNNHNKNNKKFETIKNILLYQVIVVVVLYYFVHKFPENSRLYSFTCSVLFASVLTSVLVQSIFSGGKYFFVSQTHLSPHQLTSLQMRKCRRLRLRPCSVMVSRC